MRRKKLFIFLASILMFVFFLYHQNNFISVTNIILESERLPKEFDGLKIVQLSDLHSKMFGENQNKLVSKIKKLQPDIILITGDIVDRKNYDEKPALILIDEISTIAPIYYVTGNNEFWSGRYDSLEKKMKERDITILRNSKDIFERSGSKIDIIGLDDPSAVASGKYSDEGKIISENLQKALKGINDQNFKILLSHRPELISVYAKHNIDLTFSGHAHGGQIRLPFIGGIIAPNQGWLPKYTSGEYDEGNSVMIVSRGLGNSIIPQRIFNRPEIVFVKLTRK